MVSRPLTWYNELSVDRSMRESTVRFMEKTVRDTYGEAVFLRMQKKMRVGKCDQCFKEDCSGYCFPCNLGLCGRCNKAHLRTHGVGRVG